MSHYFVSGAAGFIGSNAVDRLLALGHQVTGYDNFSTGFDEFLEGARKNPSFRLVRGDVLDLEKLTASMKAVDEVWHLAANADVRFGTEHPRRDLEQNTIGTFNVLEAVRANKVPRLAFSSTGSVYGEAKIIPTPEDAPFPIQTSLYGASKVAGEGLIQAYCEGFGLEAKIFRFVSILGPRYTHGHVIDFYRQLLNNPSTLKVLGNGHQKKSYLHIDDCISAILKACSTRTGNKCEVYNLGTQEYCEVLDSVGWLSKWMKVDPKIETTGGDRGWIGDNPFIFLDTKKICATGWKTTQTIQQSVVSTLDWLKANQWVLTRRE